VDGRKLACELAVRKDCVDLSMADPVQRDRELAALALRHEVVGLDLILGNLAITQKADRWLWLPMPASEPVSIFAGHQSLVNPSLPSRCRSA
jgi:hypothetical protein